MRILIRKSIKNILIAIVLLGTSGVVQAASTFSAGSDFTLTLSSITSFGTLGVNVFVTSEGIVDHDIRSSTGTASLSAAPVIDSPSGNWVLGSSFNQSTSLGGSAFDVVSFVSGDVATTGTITLQNFSDANTIFNFDWTLDQHTEVSQSGISPFIDYADANAEFSLSTDAICTPTFPYTAISTNTLSSGTASSISSGSLACTVLAGTSSTLSIIERASGQANAIDNVSSVPVPAALWLMLSGLGALGVISRRRGN